MSDPRQSDRVGWEPGDVLAFVYTLCYMGMVVTVMYVEVPSDNVQIVNTLVTIMSTIQIGIGKYYYDRTRADSLAQRATAVRQSSADAAIQEIAKTVPIAAAVAAAAVPASSSPLKTETVEVTADTANITEKGKDT